MPTRPHQPVTDRILDAVLSSITDFAYTFDRDGRFVYINKSLLDLWGLTLDQAVGKNFHDLQYPVDLATRLQSQIQQVIDTKSRLTDETPYTSPTGVEGYYEYIFSPVLGADGSVELVAGSTRDISARKRVERERDDLVRAVSVERAKLADVINHAPAFICTLRGPGHVFEIANEQYRELSGHRDLIGRTVRDAFPEIEGQGFFELLDEVYRTGKPFSGDELPIHLTRAGGTSAELRFLNFVYQATRDQHGAIDGIFVHGVDVTDMVRAHEAIRTSEARNAALLASERAARTDAETANKAKDRFLATLSHELRTPLTPVAMTAAAMEQDPALPAAFRDDVAMIRRNVELETQLIDDLLDLSRIMSGKMRLRSQPTGIHNVIRHVLETVGAELHDKGLKVETELKATAHTVDADAARFQQVLWNLLKNSAKFTPAGGAVTIRTRSTASHLIIDVADTGKGIVGGMLSRIFEPFEQGNAGVTTQYGGMGLGLAIAKAVVDMHGGTISAASEGEGRGATFTMSLPLSRVVKPAADGGGKPEGPTTRGRTVRVLLVEDHADTAKTLTRLLRVDGMEVQWASSVRAGLQMAGASAFDVIVSDLGLPDGTGHDLMRQLRGEGRAVGIAMSGYGMEEDIRQSQEAGFVEHLVKPVNLAELRQAIRRATARFDASGVE